MAVYTVDELAQAIGVSQRTLYAYLAQSLLPEGRRIGRQVVYSEHHLDYGLLIRALVDGGLGLEAVADVLGRLAPAHVQTFAAPLAALVQARTQLGEELAQAIRQRTPAEPSLDLADMRLEDPVALEARVGAMEAELLRLGRQLEAAFAEVRARVMTDAAERTETDLGPGSAAPGVVELAASIRALTAVIRDVALVLAPHGGPGGEPAASALRRLETHARLGEGR